MPSLERILRTFAVCATATFLWGASVACTTDELSGTRRTAAEDSTSPAGNPGSGDLPNVNVADRTESDLAEETMLHRAMYARYLHVLATYYSEHGYENKAIWARSELRDMEKLRPHDYTAEAGAGTSPGKPPLSSLDNPAGVDLQDISVAGRTELDLVEEMLLHRSTYRRYLSALAKLYSEHGQENKANWTRSETNDLRLVKMYQYINDVETPTSLLRPQESIAEADRLFDQGESLMDKGGHHIIIWYNDSTMKQALSSFKEIVDRFPTSDKVDDAAYFIAEIHKEYNQERDNEIAIQWYQKAIAWNPDLPYPAWSHIAHIYDFRMHEREKALEWYQKVLEQEKGKTGWRFWKNIDVANKRIAELTTEKTRHSPAEMASDEGTAAPSDSKAPAAGTGAEASPSAPKGP